MKKARLIISVLVAFIICLNVSLVAFAASTTIAFSQNNVELGDSVTVTVRFSGSNIAGVQFSISYDSSILTYKSCSGASFNGGTAVWYDDNSSASSHSVSFVFKANKVGSTTIQVSSVLVSDNAGDKINGFSGAAATLKVVPEETTTKAPETTTKAPATTTRAPETTTRRDSTTTTASTTENTTETTTKPKDDKVVLNGKTYTLVDDSAFVDAPDGFDETYSDYKGNRILTYTSKDKTQQIVCIEDEDGKKSFALFDDESDSFSEYIRIKSESLPLVLLAAKKNSIPESYKPVNIKINDKEIAAYQNDEFKAKGLYLLYALSLKDGNSSLYVYDENDGSIQKYYGLSVKESEPETTTEPTTQADPDNNIGMKKTTMIKAICALAVVLLASIIAVVTLAVKLRKREKAVAEEGTYTVDDDNYTE
ncbi:MAG: hypothetical protein E7515_08015 [Ruminococcaceae bacterium]|jgi:hypothetical protein|nr:hypothetical protein [Oscillospiraceae bacterium]